METYAKGSYSIQAESLEIAEAIFAALDTLDTNKSVRERLIQMHHGHSFGFCRRCICGMPEIKYHAELGRVGDPVPPEVPICPKALENAGIFHIKPPEKPQVWQPDKVLGMDIPDGWKLVELSNYYKDTGASCKAILINELTAYKVLASARNLRFALQIAIEHANIYSRGQAEDNKIAPPKKPKDTLLCDLAALLPFGGKVTVTKPENNPLVLVLDATLRGTLVRIELPLEQIGDKPNQKSSLLKEVAYMLEGAYRQLNRHLDPER